MYNMYVYVWQSLPGNLCTWAENTWSAAAVGTVNGRGYDGQQTAAICETHGTCRTFLSLLKSVFLPISTYSLCLHFSQMPRCPHLAILVTTMTDNRWQTKLIALPLVHVRMVIIWIWFIWSHGHNISLLSIVYPCRVVQDVTSSILLSYPTQTWETYPFLCHSGD